MSFSSDFAQLVARYNSSLPSLVENCQAHLQLDDKGRLIISGRYFEDSQHVSGDAGLFAMGVRDDGVKASFDGAITGVTGNVQLEADFPGLDGNSILLTGDGIKDVDTLVSDWNTANPSNTVTLLSANGADVPAAAQAMRSGIHTRTQLAGSEHRRQAATGTR